MKKLLLPLLIVISSQVQAGLFTTTKSAIEEMNALLRYNNNARRTVINCLKKSNLHDTKDLKTACAFEIDSWNDIIERITKLHLDLGRRYPEINRFSEMDTFEKSDLEFYDQEKIFNVTDLYTKHDSIVNSLVQKIKQENYQISEEHRLKQAEKARQAKRLQEINDTPVSFLCTTTVFHENGMKTPTPNNEPFLVAIKKDRVHYGSLTYGRNRLNNTNKESVYAKDIRNEHGELWLELQSFNFRDSMTIYIFKKNGQWVFEQTMKMRNQQMMPVVSQFTGRCEKTNG